MFYSQHPASGTQPIAALGCRSRAAPGRDTIGATGGLRLIVPAKSYLTLPDNKLQRCRWHEVEDRLKICCNNTIESGCGSAR